VQIKTRVAGVLAVSAAAIAIMGGPAFASGNPVTGNIVGNGNIPIASGNNAQIPVLIPVNICGSAVAILGVADASCEGGAAALLDSLNS
jgi:ChpA-C